MMFNIARAFRPGFSIFKKKCMPLFQQRYSSFSQLYQQISVFQENLSELERKKMPKKLEDFTKKLRRLYREDSQTSHSIPLKISHTYQFFVRKSDELVFGMPELQAQTTLDQLLNMTREMYESSLTPYQGLIPLFHDHPTLYQAIQQRFVNLQERLSRILFKKYTNFSKDTSKLSFLTQQRQYKGDFKFQLIDDIETIQKASECLYHCALFNNLRSKMILVCEMAVNKLHERLSSDALSRFLFCLAIAGRPQKIVEQNFLKFAQKMRDFPFELLLYMTVSQIQDTFTLMTILNIFQAEPKNSQQKFLIDLVKTVIEAKYSLKLQVQSDSSLNLPLLKHGGQLFFENFLERHYYKYSTVFNELTYHQIYNIQDIHFFCLDHRFVNTETFALNGLGLICKQYFARKGMTVKHINWPRMLNMQKRGQKDEYILSKFKGIQKPKVKKVRFYE